MLRGLKAAAGVVALPLFAAPQLGRSNGEALGRVEGGLIAVARAAYTMGTVVGMTVYSETFAHGQRVISAAFDELRRLDRLLSVYDRRSDVSRLNAEAGRACVTVGPDLLRVLAKAKEVHALTGGRFDVTVEPLMRLWGFRDETGGRVPPSDRVLRKVLEAVGMHHLVVDQTGHTAGLLDSAARIDLGGIAVGYAIDRIVHALRSAGITAAFINHSGDAYGLGAPPGSAGWPVALVDPLKPERFCATLTLRDRAIATSGAYEKFIERDGERFGHILIPHTGCPAGEWLSTTVIAESALTADALSTGMFCMGREESRSLAAECRPLEVVTTARSNGAVRIERAGQPMSWDFTVRV